MSLIAPEILPGEAGIRSPFILDPKHITLIGQIEKQKEFNLSHSRANRTFKIYRDYFSTDTMVGWIDSETRPKSYGLAWNWDSELVNKGVLNIYKDPSRTLATAIDLAALKFVTTRDNIKLHDGIVKHLPSDLLQAVDTEIRAEQLNTHLYDLYPDRGDFFPKKDRRREIIEKALETPTPYIEFTPDESALLESLGARLTPFVYKRQETPNKTWDYSSRRSFIVTLGARKELHLWRENGAQNYPLSQVELSSLQNRLRGAAQTVGIPVDKVARIQQGASAKEVMEEKI